MTPLHKYGLMLLAIKGTSSTNDKAKVLQQWATNDSALQKMLHYTLNPYITWGLTGIPKKWVKHPQSDFKNGKNFEDLVYLLGRLETRAISGDAALFHVWAFSEQLTPEERHGFRAIIRRKPDCGLNVKTVNKVFPALIPTFGIAKANSYKKREHVGNAMCRKGAIIEEKANGQRRVYLSHENKLLTSTGNVDDHWPFMNEYLAKVIPPNMMIDGEIVSPSDRNPYYVHGLCNSDKQFDRKCVDVQFIIFDVLPIKDWWDQKSIITQSERSMWINNCRFDDPLVRPVRSWWVESVETMEGIFQLMLEEGGEGIIIKDPLRPYSFKKDNRWIKNKMEDTVDAPLIAILPGKEGKFEHTTGSLQCLLENGVTVDAATGIMTDAMRDEIWDNKHKYLGKTVEIVYQTTTPDGSLQHPRWYRFREDK